MTDRLHEVREEIKAKKHQIDELQEAKNKCNKLDEDELKSVEAKFELKWGKLQDELVELRKTENLLLAQAQAQSKSAFLSKLLLYISDLYTLYCSYYETKEETKEFLSYDGPG